MISFAIKTLTFFLYSCSRTEIMSFLVFLFSGNSTQQRQEAQTPSPATTQTYRESYNYVQSTPTATSYEKQSYYQQTQAQHTATESYYQQANKYGKTGNNTAQSSTEMFRWRGFACSRCQVWCPVLCPPSLPTTPCTSFT